MDICFVFDGGYLEQFKVTAYSVIINDPEEDLFFHVLYTGIDPERLNEARQFICSFGAKIQFYPIDESVFEKLPSMGGNSYATYYKLLMFRYLNNLQQVLYLDCDIIVRKSIKDLFLIEPDKGMVVVRDKYVNRKQKAHLHAVDVEPERYFNAGVILFRFQKLRHVPDLETMLSYAAEHKESLMFHDQDILNHFFSNECGYMDEKFNFFTDYTRMLDFFFSNKRKAVIVHYASSKPWKSDYLRRFYSLYKKYYTECARLTPLHFMQKRKPFFTRVMLLGKEAALHIRNKLKRNKKHNDKRV